MSEKKSSKLIGRKPIKGFDPAQFEKLCHIQCTREEIAFFFGFSYDTLENRVVQHYKMRFAEAYEKFQSGGKTSLRHAMYLKALDGNVTMLIWLSKNYLGMCDKVETKPDEDTAIDIDTMKRDIRRLIGENGFHDTEAPK